MGTPTAVVVGGGITGLVAARDLARRGATVVVVEPDRVGGKLQTTAFDGAVLDEAADTFLARVPDGIELCRELGLHGDLVSPAFRRAYVWSRSALRPLPEAQLLGVPTDLDELTATGIVSSAGVAAARRDLEIPLPAPEGDVAIGPLFRDRLGDEVVDRLVDPLVGGINAGTVDGLSLAATAPQLDAAVRSGHPSLIQACREQRSQVADPAAPVFYAPRGGMGALAQAVRHDAEAHGATTVRARATGLERSGTGWRVVLDGAPALDADGVVVATPAGPAAELVHPHAARAATLLAAIPYASVALLSIAVDRAGVEHELDATGYLVPSVEGRTITACSWASSKWAHLADPGTAWLRASVGRDGDDHALRLGDDELVARVLEDLRETMGLHGIPREVRVSRLPGSFPQYRPGHLDRVEAIDADLAASAPGVVVAGAALRGLGVPACIRQGRQAAQRLGVRLDPG
ncbi:MAG: protoporphyrinogen oxidase [Acidimicrobiia bacterium]|jgi:protoporphyrinogen/coproporphyrinogen III oxidase